MQLLGTHRSLKAKKVVTRAPTSDSPSAEDNMSIPRSDCFPRADRKCLETPSQFFLINFYNIGGHGPIFQSIKHHLSSTKLHILPTETQVSEATNSAPFSVFPYFLYHHFRFKAGCSYMLNDMTCSRIHVLEFLNFSSIWLWLKTHSITKFSCAVYLSPNSSEYRKFCDCLTSILSLPFHGNFHLCRFQCSPTVFFFFFFFPPLLLANMVN